jgi:flagellar motor switch protein FliM
MPIHHLLRMGRGAVIELDTTENDPLRVYANNTLIAEGEVKVDDGQPSVELTRKDFQALLVPAAFRQVRAFMRLRPGG